MSRHILDALMQLFALITLREEGLDRGREVVANFPTVPQTQERYRRCERYVDT